MFCSPESAQQDTSHELLLQCSPRDDSITTFVEYLSCNSEVCNYCIQGFFALIENSFFCTNPSLTSIRQFPEVPFGFCCAFKKSIDPNSKITVTKPPRSPNLPLKLCLINDSPEITEIVYFKTIIMQTKGLDT